MSASFFVMKDGVKDGVKGEGLWACGPAVYVYWITWWMMIPSFFLPLVLALALLHALLQRFSSVVAVN